MPLNTEEINYLNSRLNYYYKRFVKIQKNLQEQQYASDLDLLLKHFEQSLTSNNNLRQKSELLENFMLDLEPTFAIFLQEKIDEQYLNEEIMLEIWYLQQLTLALAGELATEIENKLPSYKEALYAAKSLDEKYDKFADIGSSFSAELLDIFETEPEHVAIINAHLELMRLYLLYLLQPQNETAEEFAAMAEQLLNEVKHVINNDSYEHKMQVLDRFDDMESEFGRYLNYKINEFQLDTFSLL